MRSLRRMPLSFHRQHYTRIALLPFVLSVSTCMALIAPRAWLVYDALQIQYEAYAVVRFGMLLIMLLNHQSAVRNGDSLPEGRVIDSHSSFDLDYTPEERVITALASQGPKKHFAVPPLCFLLWPCLPEHDLTPRHLLIVMFFVRQFVFVSPAMIFFLLWVQVSDMDEEVPIMKINRMVAEALNKATAMLALYGIFVLYNSTRTLLHPWSTTGKFVAIKLILAVDVSQKFILQIVVGEGGFRCGLQGENLANYWCSMLLSWECIGLALIILHAFPAKELHSSGVEYARNIDPLLLREQSRRIGSPAVVAAV